MWRAIIAFSGKGQGWTETLFRDATEPRDQAFSRLSGYVLTRLNLLHPQYRIMRARLSNDDTPRDAQLLPAPPLGYQGEYPTNAGLTVPGAEEPDDALLLRISNNDFSHTRNYWLHGIPEDIEDARSGTYSPSANWVRNLGDFINELAGRLPRGAAIRPGNGWFIRTFDKSAMPWPINSLVPASPTGFTIKIQAGLLGAALARGEKVRIRGVRRPSSANRLWTVTDVDVSTAPATVTLRVPRSEVGGALWDGGGTAQKFGPAQSLIQDVLPEKLTTHRVGRPFGIAAGRARNRG